MPDINTQFTATKISPLIMKLDARNPRFLATQPTQENARIYLLQYSKVRELARQIVTAGGLYPGERVVVFKNEENEYIILEGNRRVCACQLLLDPSLIPQFYQFGFVSINDITRNSINEIDVDVVQSREAADQFLAARHIGGVERWDPLAKMKFFEEKFAAGQTVDEIASSNNFPKAEIKKDITEYYLFHAGYSLPCWTPSQKENQLNLFKIETTPFIRIFTTRGAKAAFKLKFNITTLRPESDLPSGKFERILQQIMYCAYIATDAAEKIDTRTPSWSNVPGVQEILDEVVPGSGTSGSGTSGSGTSGSGTSGSGTSGSGASGSGASGSGASGAGTSGSGTSGSGASGSGTSGSGTSGSGASGSGTSGSGASGAGTSGSGAPSPSSNSFFEALIWSTVADQPENQGLISVAEEIKGFSQRPNRGLAAYQSYPIAATTLLRSIIEQAFKYHLKKMNSNEFLRLKTQNNGTDPALGVLIKHYRQNNNYQILIPDRQIQRVFITLFGTAASYTSDTEEFLNLTMHQPTHVRPNATILEGRASSGLFSLVYYILNS